MTCVSVVIADRHPVFLRGLISVLGGSGKFNIVASCRHGIECMRALRELSPDIALIDVSMPGLSGFDILTTARNEGLSTRVLFMTATAEPRQLLGADTPGAYGVIPKDVPPDILIYSLQRVANGQRLLPFHGAPQKAVRRPAGRVAREPRISNKVKTLSERQRQIVYLVSEGMSNKEVGSRLTLTEGTVKVHLHNIYQKLAINNRTALTALAMSLRDERLAG